MACYPRIFLLSAGVFLGLTSNGFATEEIAFFESKVRPILVANCYECHSEEAEKRKGGLWLDRKAGWVEGGDAGPSIVPGRPDDSLFIQSIRYKDPHLQMPPKTRLSNEDVAVLEEWVARGAVDPRSESLAGAVRKEAIDFVKAREGWAFRPVVQAETPKRSDDQWSRGTVDQFLFSRMKEEGFDPTSDAEPRDLLRRLHFDLTGLPPTRDEVEKFERDPSFESYCAVVDDLLSRTTFGEKWGRHWLDVARYADSNGGDRNFTFYQAWRYRNWVIDSFNRDLPYYDFVRMQLAGDLLPSDNPEERGEQLIASTFLALGPKMLTERDKEKLWLDTADEQLDTMGRAFLGLTLGCARCHDHKFDPISQEDYYAVAGIFRSTEVVTGTRNGCVNVASWIERALPVGGEKEQELQEKVERLELAMRLTVEKSFMKKAGGKMAIGDLPLAGVIYDDSDAELVGTWKPSTHSANRFGAGYVHDDQKFKGENRAIFRGSLPESGVYEVRIAYSASGNRASKVPVRIVGRNGTETVILDQTKSPEVGGLFQPIGRFEFEKGGACRVEIETRKTEGRYVIVDAVQFISERDIVREQMAIAAVDGGGEDMLFRMNEKDLKKELNRLIEDLKDEEVVMAPRDARDAGDIHLRVRGESGQLGEIIPRGFLTVLAGAEKPEIGAGRSGRLELAEWITRPDNGLLDRVYVNRVWHHLFHRGIVTTVDNFGALGTGPSHPELLDYLAFRFRSAGGSTKKLIREIVQSRGYQMSSEASEETEERDPDNQWFARQNHRRLTAEEIRDSILLLSNGLDFEPGKATASTHGVDLDKPFSFAAEKKRTVYLPVARNNPATELAVFDGANPDLVSGARSQTTVPTQALYLLNSDFMYEQASTIAGEALEAESTLNSRVEWLYETLLGRRPDPVELEEALSLTLSLNGGQESDESLQVALGHLAHALLASTEFLYLN